MIVAGGRRRIKGADKRTASGRNHLERIEKVLVVMGRPAERELSPSASLSVCLSVTLVLPSPIGSIRQHDAGMQDKRRQKLRQPAVFFARLALCFGAWREARTSPKATPERMDLQLKTHGRLATLLCKFVHTTRGEAQVDSSS